MTPFDPEYVPGFKDRRHWLLAEHQKRVEVTRSMIEERFHVSTKTGKRDLSELGERGLIQYVRNPWPGHYALRGTP